MRNTLISLLAIPLIIGCGIMDNNDKSDEDEEDAWDNEADAWGTAEGGASGGTTGGTSSGGATDDGSSGGSAGDETTGGSTDDGSSGGSAGDETTGGSTDGGSSGGATEDGSSGGSSSGGSESDGGDAGGDEEGTDDSSSGPSVIETTINAIQIGIVEEGAVVTISDVVVTSQITEGESPSFFVQSPAGGPYNGIYIYKYDAVEYTPVIGDVVTITGEYNEFYGMSQLKLTEPEHIEVTGTDGPVVVTELDEEPSDWEAFESVLVQINDATILDASRLYEWGAVELDIGCWMDNDFADFDVEDGGRYTSITGPISYSFEKFAVLPRSAADLVGYVAPTTEDGSTGISSTVAAVQTGTIAEGSVVELSGVVATSGLNKYESGFFVQDIAGGHWSGVYVYVYDEVAATLTDLVPGELLSVTGEVTEFYDFTEVVVTDTADISRTGEVAAVMIDIVEGTADDWEPWEGCLITTDAVTVIGEADEHGAAPLDNGLFLDDDFMDFDIVEDASYASVTGVISYAFDEYRLLPRTSDDLPEPSFSGDAGVPTDGVEDCDNGTDDDGDSFVDCDDFDCAEDSACDEEDDSLPISVGECDADVLDMEVSVADGDGLCASVCDADDELTYHIRIDNTSGADCHITTSSTCLVDSVAISTGGPAGSLVETYGFMCGMAITEHRIPAGDSIETHVPGGRLDPGSYIATVSIASMDSSVSFGVE